MKDFLKNNFVLVLGVALPVLLLAVLMVVQGLSRATVAPPQYPVLYLGADNHYGHTAFDFRIKDQRLEITYTHYNMSAHHSRPYDVTLAVYDAAADKLTTYDIRPPEPLPGKDETVTLKVPEPLSGMRLSDNLEAPDGYLFEQAGRSGGFFPGFFGYRGDRKHRVVKDGAAYTLPELTGRHYYHRFVGWVIKGEEKTQ